MTCGTQSLTAQGLIHLGLVGPTIQVDGSDGVEEDNLGKLIVDVEDIMGADHLRPRTASRCSDDRHLPLLHAPPPPSDPLPTPIAGRFNAPKARHRLGGSVGSGGVEVAGSWGVEVAGSWGVEGDREEPGN
ncbi:hypothetical protein E2562_035036 [Oryza meyeriana var. granulata]|uniref:Uncharacterized protein n=1 Tax=Oryza meyeriana var. granulata TaxID=110450 RepID=A0A6G1FFB9_9ORYZ|nr:hypothetical protein E2562_035036 [Oryza meyeriana var. granulata]